MQIIDGDALTRDLNRRIAESGTEPAPRLWLCVYCGAAVEDGSECMVPSCVEARAAARRRMGVEG